MAKLCWKMRKKHKIITLIPTEFVSKVSTLLSLENGKMQSYVRRKCFVNIVQGLHGELQNACRINFFNPFEQSSICLHFTDSLFLP